MGSDVAGSVGEEVEGNEGGQLVDLVSLIL